MKWLTLQIEVFRMAHFADLSRDLNLDKKILQNRL